MTIRVTKQHIAKGLAHKCTSCPIALAMTDAGLSDVSVGSYDATYFRDGCFFRVQFPIAISNRIEQFDLGYEIEPFSFELNPKGFIVI